MKTNFTADFKDGGHAIKISLSERGVTFRMLRVRDGPEYFIPYEVAYRLGAKLAAWGGKNEDRKDVRA